MTCKIIILTLASVVIICVGEAQAQKDDAYEDVQEAIDMLFQEDGTDIDYGALYNTYFLKIDKAQSLNQITKSELQSIYFLNDFQISAFIDYRKKHGPIRSKYELVAIDHFDKKTARRLLNFTSLKQESNDRSIGLGRSRTNIMLRYERMTEEKKGYTAPDTSADGSLTQRYLGDPSKMVFRFKNSKPGKYSFGITAEKDPGERLYWNHDDKAYGADYYALHLQLQNIGVFDQITLGDYSFESGQGLIYGAGFNIGKGSETIFTTEKNQTGATPYGSAFESKPFSGISATSTFKNLTASLILSQTNRDARLKYDSLSGYDAYFENLKNTGLHRTNSETSSRKVLTEKNVGINVHWTSASNRLTVGINSMYTWFSEPIFQKQLAYHLSAFQGNKLFNNSLYASYSFKRIKIFNEIALSDNGGNAAILGMISAPMDNFKLSILARNLSRKHTSFHGNPFSSGNNISNEQGVYLGMQYDISGSTSLSGYFDQYKHPFAHNRFLNSTDGHDWLVNINHTLSDKIRLRGNIRQRVKENIATSDDSKTDKPVNFNKLKAYLHLNAESTSGVHFITRVAWNRLKQQRKRSSGFLMYQQVEWNTEDTYIAGRYTLFDAEAFDNRLYVYEHDLSYSFPFPFYYKKGASIMLLIKQSIFNFLKLEIKAKRTFYSNVQELGSGLEKVNGNKRTKLKFQFLFAL